MSNQNNTGKQKKSQENLRRSRPYSSGMSTHLHSKRHGSITLKMSLKEERMVIGLKTMVPLLILLVLITCTCSGPRLMLGTQSLGSQTGYSLSSGKHVRLTTGVTECAILKTVDQDLALCLQQRPYLRQQLLRTHASGFCPNLVLMLRRCSQTRLYRYPRITPSSSNPSKTEWTVPRRSLPTGSQPPSLPESPSRNKEKKNSQGSIQQLTGETLEITPTMGKSCDSLYTMKVESGKSPIISSTTGVSLKLH